MPVLFSVLFCFKKGNHLDCIYYLQPLGPETQASIEGVEGAGVLLQYENTERDLRRTAVRATYFYDIISLSRKREQEGRKKDNFNLPQELLMNQMWLSLS